MTDSLKKLREEYEANKEIVHGFMGKYIDFIDAQIKRNQEIITHNNNLTDKINALNKQLFELTEFLMKK